MGVPTRGTSSLLREQQFLPKATSRGRTFAAEGLSRAVRIVFPRPQSACSAIRRPCGLRSCSFPPRVQALSGHPFAVEASADRAASGPPVGAAGGTPSTSVPVVHSPLFLHTAGIGGDNALLSPGRSASVFPTPADPFARKRTPPSRSLTLCRLTVYAVWPGTRLPTAVRILPAPVTSLSKLHAVAFLSCPLLASPYWITGSAAAAARSVSYMNCGGYVCGLLHRLHNKQQRRKQQASDHQLYPKGAANACSTPHRQHVCFLQQQQQLLVQQRLPHHQRFVVQQLLQQPQAHHQQLRRNFSSGFPNTKKRASLATAPSSPANTDAAHQLPQMRRITNPFWRRTGWWDWRRREVGKLNKARARRRHLWPRGTVYPLRAAGWERAAIDGEDGLSSLSRRVLGLAAAKSPAAAIGEIDVKAGRSAAAAAAARAAAAVEAAAAAVKHCTQKKPRWLEENSLSGRRVILPVEGARQRPFWRRSRQKMLQRHRDAVAAAERAARSLAEAEEREEEEEFALAAAGAGQGESEDNAELGRKRLGQVRLTEQDLQQVKKGRGRVWEERKDGIPLGKKRLLLYCRLIKGAQITDAIDWLSALCIHRVNYLLNLLLKTRQKIHEEGGDIGRVYVESYMLNIQGRAKRLQFRLRMVNFIKTWRFAVIIRCRELPLDEFFHRVFILKKVPRSLTSDMRLALVEKRVPPGVVREWYPYLDASTRFWHRHRLRWLDRTRQFDYYIARKAFKATYEENCRRRRVQLLEARGAPTLLIEKAKQS